MEYDSNIRESPARNQEVDFRSPSSTVFFGLTYPKPARIFRRTRTLSQTSVPSQCLVGPPLDRGAGRPPLTRTSEGRSPLRTSSKRKRLVLAGLVTLTILMIPVGAWLSLTYRPSFYRALTNLSPDQREAKAKRFVAGSLQLRNDISNERDWQAVFTDQEVNAWLAEDLVTHFADLIPPEIHEPRIAFDADRVTLAFQLDRGPIRSVIWVVAQARVPEDNVLALTLEKIRAGVFPISVDRLVGPINAQARAHGLDIHWTREQGLPVALIRYQPDEGRSDVVLESLSIRRGQLRLSGRSDRLQGTAVRPVLPTRRILQLNFPKRNTHLRRSTSSTSTLRSSTVPTT